MKASCETVRELRRPRSRERRTRRVWRLKKCKPLLFAVAVIAAAGAMAPFVLWIAGWLR